MLALISDSHRELSGSRIKKPEREERRGSSFSRSRKKILREELSGGALRSSYYFAKLR